MNNDNDLLPLPPPINQKPNSSFKSLQPLALLAVVFFIAVVVGTGSYLLRIKTGQKSEIISQPAPIAITTPTTKVTATPTPTVSLTTIPEIPTEIPALTANWKKYTNAQWGLSFKYPETWFPQEVLGWDPPGDLIKFYAVGATPHPGALGGYPSNAVFYAERRPVSQQTNEQFINAAPQIYGYERLLNVAGKPAIRVNWYNEEWYYIIKLSSTRLLVLNAYSKDGGKELDTIISTIKFTTP